MARNITVGKEHFNDGEFEPIPAGTKIKVSVYDVKEGVSGPNSKYPGKAQFEWTAKVTEDGPYKGREIRYNYVPLDGTVPHAWNLTQFASAVGWPADPDTGVEVPDNLNDVLGTEIVAKIGQTDPNRDPEKRVFNRVDKVFPLPKGGGGGITEKPKVSWDDLNK